MRSRKSLRSAIVQFFVSSRVLAVQLFPINGPHVTRSALILNVAGRRVYTISVSFQEKIIFLFGQTRVEKEMMNATL